MFTKHALSKVYLAIDPSQHYEAPPLVAVLFILFILVFVALESYRCFDKKLYSY